MLHLHYRVQVADCLELHQDTAHWESGSQPHLSCRIFPGILSAKAMLGTIQIPTGTVFLYHIMAANAAMHAALMQALPVLSGSMHVADESVRTCSVRPFSAAVVKPLHQCRTTMYAFASMSPSSAYHTIAVCALTITVHVADGRMWSCPC